MTTADLFPFALLGGVLGLDVVSFPQAMVSRPLVAATVAGFMAGNGEAGLLMGAALELIALETLPFGASRYPEWGSAAVVGGALFASTGGTEPGSMSVAMIGALATAMVGGWTMVMVRKLNGYWARHRLAALDRGSYRTVVGLQLYGMTADLLRGMALTFLALLVLHPVADAVIALWTFDGRFSRAVAVGVAALVAAGAAWKLFHGTAGTRSLFLGGLVVGLTVIAMRLL